MVSTSGGTNSPIIRDHFVDQVGDREEARDRQERQKRREESEKEIVGLLRAEVERVVGEEFLDRALR